MNMVLNKNPLYIFYEILEKYLDAYIKEDTIIGDTKDDDSIVRAILLNNGCTISSNSKYTTFEVEGTDIFIQFITNAQGNEKNIYYDIIDCYASTYIVIFPDYFEIKHNIFDEDDDSIEANLARLISNSVYFSAISNLVNIFNIIYNSNISQLPNTTSAKMNMINNKYIIAAKIIDTIAVLCEDDIDESCMYDYNTMKELIQKDINLVLMGIREMP